MDEGVFAPNIVLGTPSDCFMDLDYMDELLLEGCWLETADGSGFLQQSPSLSNPLLDSPFIWPALEDNKYESGGSPSKVTQEERHRSSFPEHLSVSQSQAADSAKTQSLGENVHNANGLSSLAQPENHLVEGSELSRRWWIGPRSSSSVMDRLIRALGFIKDCSRDKNILLQIWVPVNRGGRRVLITNDQPFQLDLNCPSLAHYRDISVNYQFPAEEDSKEIAGLPGRVFMGKVPEWTPNVQFFRKDEYPRVGHAQQLNVRGTLAVPVFEENSRNCLGVIEVVLTTQKIKYRPELENVCKALEAVNLRTSEVSSPSSVKVIDQACDLAYQAALPEILEVLRSACGRHGLPLAQTWVPCAQQGKSGCRHSDENLLHCVSTVDSACYIADPSVQSFHEACSEHHLLKGQGVAGQAFSTNEPCFSPDVTSYSKSEYPLSHYARMFGLSAAVAIRLRTIYTGSADFVLEFFLPMDCKDPEEHKKLLTSLSFTIQQLCRTLRVVTEEELREEIAPSFTKEMPKVEHAQFTRPIQETSTQVPTDLEVQNFAHAVSALQDGKLHQELSGKSSEFSQHYTCSNSRHGASFSGNYYTSSEGTLLQSNKTGEKRRTKAEKTITLQILRQYFAGSLKDAAKSIGVCPTTLKRICRQYGIKRWPSRKIKKVGHSLQKIQRVIDSVQGASGALQIESFYSSFPELASPNLPGSSPLSNLKPDDQPKALSRQPDDGILIHRAAVSRSPSSSCSQSSNSSQCCSSGTQPPHLTSNITAHDNPGPREEPVNAVIKRARSDADLHLSCNTSKLLPRSQSHVMFNEHPPISAENLPPVPKDVSCKPRGEGNPQRVKVTYGEEKIRFRLQHNWGYRELLHEIAKRFSIDDISGYHLKYLDDDSEWVLLTCDADLDECIDVCRPSRDQTIRLSFLRDNHLHYGSSFGSSNPL